MQIYRSCDDASFPKYYQLGPGKLLLAIPAGMFSVLLNLNGVKGTTLWDTRWRSEEPCLRVFQFNCLNASTPAIELRQEIRSVDPSRIAAKGGGLFGTWISRLLVSLSSQSQAKS